MNYIVNVSLPRQLADLAKDQVKNGHYSTLSEVIRTALRHFLKLEVPVYRLSKKAEERAKQAREDHQKGKTRLLNSIDDLDSL